MILKSGGPGRAALCLRLQACKTSERATGAALLALARRAGGTGRLIEARASAARLSKSRPGRSMARRPVRPPLAIQIRDRSARFWKPFARSFLDGGNSTPTRLARTGKLLGHPPGKPRTNEKRAQEPLGPNAWSDNTCMLT